MTPGGTDPVQSPLLHGWHEPYLAVTLAMFRNPRMGPSIGRSKQLLDVGSKERHDKGRPLEGNREAGEMVEGGTSEGHLQAGCWLVVRSAWRSVVDEWRHYRALRMSRDATVG